MRSCGDPLCAIRDPDDFVHGWGSSSHAEEKMANAARDAGVTKTIVWANVDKKGKPPNSRKCR